MAYPREKVDEALALVDTGKSHTKVGRIMGIPQVTISAWVRDRRIDAPVFVPDTDPTPAPNVPQKIALSSLCLDAGTQMRVQLNERTIDEYADAMRESATFPPVIVFTDEQSYWLADGFQRVKAAEKVGYDDIAADIRPGTLRDATLFSCGANSTHGERRTNADKRKSVLTLLNDGEWSQFSDRRIADICGVTHPFVAEVRNPKVKDVRKPDDSVVSVTTNTSDDELNTRPEAQPSETNHDNKNNDIMIDEAPAPQVSPADQTRPAGSMFDDVFGHVPSPCATCGEVRPLIDEVLAQLHQTGLMGYTERLVNIEQILLTVRDLVTEKTAVGNA